MYPVLIKGFHISVFEILSFHRYFTITKKLIFVMLIIKGPNTPVRINGTKQSGVPEFNYKGRWGTICNENFDTKDASVICNMLGFRIG